MIVCVCFRVSEKDIKQAVKTSGARTIEDLQKTLLCCDRCRSCEPFIEAVIQESIAGECDGSTVGS